MNVPEVIVGIVADGGAITLVGLKDASGRWRFARTVSDRLPLLGLEGAGGEPGLHHTSDWVDSWPDAVKLLDKYPWALYAVDEVHPEFRERIWIEVSQRLHDTTAPRVARKRDRWANACARGKNT